MHTSIRIKKNLYSGLIFGIVIATLTILNAAAITLPYDMIDHKGFLIWSFCVLIIGISTGLIAQLFFLPLLLLLKIEWQVARLCFFYILTFIFGPISFFAATRIYLFLGFEQRWTELPQVLYILIIALIAVVAITFFLMKYIISWLEKFIHLISTQKTPQRYWLFISLGIIIICAVALLYRGMFLGHIHLDGRSNLEYPNILLISVDSLRADYLKSYGRSGIETPNMDRLALTGIRFSNTVSVAPYTWTSLASIITSTYPYVHGVRKNGWKMYDINETIGEYLRGKGTLHEQYAISDIPLNTMGLKQGFKSQHKIVSVFHQISTKAFLYVTKIVLKMAPDTLERVGFGPNSSMGTTIEALNWLHRYRNKRWFLWIHYYNEPHAPYHSPKPFSTKYDPVYQGVVDGGTDQLRAFNFNRHMKTYIKGPLKPSDEDISHLKALYKGEITLVDMEIGYILDFLEKRDLVKNTLIVLTADHGEDLGEKGHFLHSDNLYDTLLKVPLIFSYRGYLPEGQVYDVPVSTLDIVPTMIELLGIPPSPKFQGKSLLPIMKDSHHPLNITTYSERMVYRDYDRFKPDDLVLAVRNKSWKLIYVPRTGEKELYNIIEDPAEITNLSEQNPGIIEDMLQSVLEKLALSDIQQLIPKKDRTIDKESMDILKALGYL